MAIQALLVILAVLLVLLFLGVPISYAIAAVSYTHLVFRVFFSSACLATQFSHGRLRRHWA